MFHLSLSKRTLKTLNDFLFPFLICEWLFAYRSLGYKDDTGEKPSDVEMVTVQASAGMVAGACSSVITTPIDTVKTRLQVWEMGLLSSGFTVVHEGRDF